MIFDSLENSSTYYALSERLRNGFEYLKTTDLASLEPGKYEIDGDRLFVLIQEYDTKPLADGKWESHKKYLDIQYLISGNEIMGYANITALTDKVDHTQEKDLLNYKDGNNSGCLLSLNAGEFALFFPQDGHMPNVTLTSSSKNKKAVVKILI